MNNGAITSTNCPTHISITDTGCDEPLDVETVLISVGKEENQQQQQQEKEHAEEKLPLHSIVNEKHHQSQYASDGSGEATCQFSAPKTAGTNDNGDGKNGCNSRELNFLNLRLQCSDDDHVSVISKSNVDLISNRISAEDDETEIEISDIEAITEIGESIFENHRCTHCGRGHCCFFLRCCYCTSNRATNDSNKMADANTNPSPNPEALHENNPCRGECDSNRSANSNNIPLGSCTEIGSKQNLASKRCDEICKLIRNQHRTGLCSSTKILAKKQCCEESIIDDNDKHCTVTKLPAIGCHCRWYCIQDCDSDTKTTGAVDDRPKTENTLAIQEPKIVSPIANESPLTDENRLRCCRCSRELF